MPEDYSSAEWADICRAQAALTLNKSTRKLLLDLARDYDGASERQHSDEAEPSSVQGAQELERMAL